MSIFSDIANKLTSGKQKDEDSELEPMTSLSEQSPDEKRLVEYVKQKIDQVRQTNSRIAIEGVALTNISYLLGFDGVYYDTTYRQFKNIDPRRKLTRNRYKVNKILPTIQNRLSRLVQNSPKYDVRPETDSSQDKDCARLGVQVIDDILDKQNFTEKQQDLLMNCMQGGVAYLQVLWDPILGKPMVDPEDESLTGYEGDVRIDVLNVLEVFTDPLAKSLDDAQWWIKAKVRKLDYFKDTYPERGQAVKEEGAWLLSSIYDLKSNAMTSVGIVGAQTQEQMKNSAIELIYNEKRSTKYPQGRKIVCASGVLLEDKELPIGEFDLIKFDDILIGGRYNSEAVITHLRPVQDEYNVTRTKMAEWVRKLLAGKFLVAKGAGIGQETLNNDTEVVEYNMVPNAPPPTAMSIPVMPSYAYEEVKSLSDEFDFVSGINEATRGIAPSASMPFRGMALLVEQDQTRISVQTSRNEVGYARMASCILKYVGRYYEMPRVLKEIAGEGLGYTVKEFMGSDLNGNYDVVCIPGSSLPNSKALKRQDIINAYQMGILGDPQDPKLRAKVLKMLEYGEVSEMWKSQALDEQQIAKTIGMIEEGKQPPVHEWDNHALFIQELNDYRKTDKFDELDKRSQGILNMCVEQHIQAIVALNNPQIPQQQMMAEHMMNAVQQHKAAASQPGGPLSVVPPDNGPPQQPDMENAPGGMPGAPPTTGVS